MHVQPTMYIHLTTISEEQGKQIARQLALRKLDSNFTNILKKKKKSLKWVKYHCHLTLSLSAQQIIV